MSDAQDPATGQRLRDALRDGSIQVPHATWKLDGPEVSALGTGESYAAWLASDGTTSIVFRLPRRPPGEMPTSMADEMRAARFIPGDIGSRPILIDETSANPLGRAFIASTFAAGSVRPTAEWDVRLLHQHAHQLARLHDARFAVSGPVDGAGSAVDIVGEFDDGYAWWRKTEPRLATSGDVSSLAADIRSRLLALAPAFEGISYSFIHGDLVVPNVVVDDFGMPRFIDWEWARIGDVAQDLAAIGGQVTGGPWYIRMDTDAVRAFLASYLEGRAHLGIAGPETLETLQRRRDAWELTERFLSSLHCAKQARDLPEPGFYPEAVSELRRTLRSRVASGM